MLEELKKVLAGIRRDTQRLLDNTLKSYLQIARYDVTTAPNGTVIGVTRPFSNTEIQIPYLPYCANAAVGDTVLVVWWGSLTNAQAWFKLPAEPGILNFRPGGGGAAFGKTAETDGVLDVAWDIIARQNLLIDGAVVSKATPPFSYGSKVILLPYCQYTDIGANGTLEDFIDKYLRYIAANYMNQGTNAVYIGTIAYNNTFAGDCMMHMYSESAGTGLPFYCSGVITTPNGISFFNTQNYSLTIRSI